MQNTSKYKSKIRKNVLIEFEGGCEYITPCKFEKYHHEKHKLYLLRFPAPTQLFIHGQ